MLKTSGNLNPEARQRLYYSKTAKFYDQMHNANTGEHALALRHFLAYANEFGFHKVLDVGCGTGVALAKMLKAGLDARGIEPVRELIDVGLKKHKIPKSRLKIGKAETINFSSNSFDAVTILWGLSEGVGQGSAWNEGGRRGDAPLCATGGGRMVGRGGDGESSAHLPRAVDAGKDSGFGFGLHPLSAAQGGVGQSAWAGGETGGFVRGVCGVAQGQRGKSDRERGVKDLSHRRAWAVLRQGGKFSGERGGGID